MAKSFISAIVNECKKIEQLLKTNVEIKNIDFKHHNEVIEREMPSVLVKIY